ncbi:hypothetical protein [Streptomyces sp. NPDC058861]|uniref:hypothetical protein n=1 Tax=Streptomyces sp. NPDC058861 TaxID=3346653 RepID=UPI003685C8D9
MTTLTYRELRAMVQAEAKGVTHDGEAIRALERRARSNAETVARAADALAGMEVDSQTTGEAKDTARIMNGLTTSALAAASATDNVAAAARAVDAQAQKSHGGINEQAGAMNVRMAKSAFYEQE